MEPLGGEKLGAEAEPRRAVVVAGDHDHRHAEAAHDAPEDVVEQLDGLGGRHAAVVDVAGDEHGRGPHVGDQVDELVEDVLPGRRSDGRVWNSRPRCQSAVWMNLMRAPSRATLAQRGDGREGACGPGGRPGGCAAVRRVDCVGAARPARAGRWPRLLYDDALVVGSAPRLARRPAAWCVNWAMRRGDLVVEGVQLVLGGARPAHRLVELGVRHAALLGEVERDLGELRLGGVSSRLRPRRLSCACATFLASCALKVTA